MEQVKDAGFLYDSSLMASDDAYELLLDGKPTGVVELPIERILDDFPYFGGDADGSNPSVGDVYEVFQSEFDVAYEEGGLYILTMHPHIMGHRSRVAMLEKLIQHMKPSPACGSRRTSRSPARGAASEVRPGAEAVGFPSLLRSIAAFVFDPGGGWGYPIVQQPTIEAGFVALCLVLGTIALAKVSESGDPQAGIDHPRDLAVRWAGRDHVVAVSGFLQPGEKKLFRVTAPTATTRLRVSIPFRPFYLDSPRTSTSCLFMSARTCPAKYCSTNFSSP